MTPLVSIIIPCYNAEQWIAQAIRSALDQTWPNKEIIVIDDGSKDHSLDEIKAFGGKIRWESGPNRGGCAARNRGLEVAHGEWIQFLDADDVLVPDCVAAKVTTGHDLNERVCCDVALMDDGYVPMEDGGIPEFWKQKRYDLTYLIRVGAPQTASPLHRRVDLLRINGFRAGLPCAQDLDLHLRMAIQLRIIFVSNGKTGVLLRRMRGSVSDSGYDQMPLVNREVILNALNLLTVMGGDRDGYVDAVAQRMALLGRQLFRMERPNEAVRCYHEAKRISPRWYEGVYKSWPTTVLARTVGFSAFETIHRAFRSLRGKKTRY